MMGNVCVSLLWVLALIAWKSSCQAQCTCSGFVRSQEFEELSFVYENQRTLSLVPGYEYEIDCNDNTAEPSWYYNGQTVSSSTSATTYQFSNGANKKTLKFISFSEDQVGNYSCSKPCGYCTIDISAGNPVINLDMQSGIVAIDSAKKIFLTYVLMGTPIPSSDNVMWFHNGAQLIPSNNSLDVIGIPNGLLITFKYYEGDYTAVVSTSAGTGSDTFHLNVNFFPVASLSVECSECSQSGSSNNSYTLSLQSYITITCNNIATTDLDSLEFTWKKDNQPLTTTDQYNITQISSSTSQLMFEIGNFTDTGSYECFVENDIGSNTKGVHINVLYRPVISPLSPYNITWISGNDGSIQVLYEGGFPEPNVTWNRQLTEPFQQETLHGDGSNFLFSGMHLLNLTVTNVALADAGDYSITVVNYLGNMSLWFKVDVIVPPRLEPITETPLDLPTGSKVTLEVAILDAFPLVVEDDITWSSSDGTETFNGTHATVTLSDVSPGNPSEVTIIVSHPARDVNHTFQLNVLDPPGAPVNFMVTKYMGSTCQAMFTWESAVPLNNATSAPTNKIGLEQRKGSSDQWEQLSDDTYPADPPEPIYLPVKPEVTYNFRAYSWSELVGRGNETMEVTFDTTTVHPQIMVESIAVTGINSSSIAVNWSSPLHDSSCYVILGYKLVCNSLVDDSIVIDITIEAKPEPHSTYSVIITELSPDRSYQCSVSVTGNDSVGDPISNKLPVIAQGSTFPKPPPEPPSLSVVSSSDVTSSNRNPAGTFTLDLTPLSVLTPMDASHIWIAVLRLGGSPTLPDRPPDVMYPKSSSFFDPSRGGSPAAISSSGQYLPYVAQEFNVGSIPASFVVGNGSNSGDSFVRRQAVSTYNGPLEMNDYYTAFVRVFSPSTLSLDKQYVVFRSSEYIVPVQPESVDTLVDEGLSDGAAAFLGIFCVIVIGILATAVVVGFIVWYRFKRAKVSTPSHAENGNLNMKHTLVANSSDAVLLKSAASSVLDDRDEYNETEDQISLEEPIKKSPILENQPLAFKNPYYDHLQKGAGHLTPSEASSSPIASPGVPERHFFNEYVESPCIVPEKHFFKETEGSPDHKRLDTPSPSSYSTEESSKGEMTRTLEASKRIHRDDFQEHVDELDADGQAGFKEEFKYIQEHSVNYPAVASSAAQPFSKNRYRNIPAFDHTRVKLNQIPNVLQSDYINANFVKGYDDHKRYIATQGPMYETHCDFWRMVWEQKSTAIVMLTKLFDAETCQDKCYKYWPDIEEKSKAYGEFVVRQDQQIVLPYYTIRSFKIVPAIGERTERTVLQFHYTDWPDKNVPALASSLIDFLRAVNSANKDVEQGPIVVHCSAGVGRTGTIIALDMCLDQLQNEEMVDVRGVVTFLREQRSQMIQVLSQYIFLHHALLETIVYGDTSVLLKEFPDYFKRLQTENCKPISEEFNKICKVKPPAQANASPDVVQLESTNPLSGQQMLFTAHHVDGYWEKKKFIVCEPPSAETIGQFWQLVWDKKCSTVIMVTPNNFQHFGGYLLDVGQEETFGNLKIKFEKQQSRTGFTSRSVVITNEFDGSSQSVKHMQYECWVSSRHFNVPPFVKFVSDVILQAELPDILKQPIIVHDDGACGSAGALVSLVYCFQRLKQERIIDLLQAVNRLHLQCPDLIDSLQLYDFCYNCLQEFTTKLLREDSVPPIYENIASIRGRVQPKSPPPPDPREKELLDTYEIL